MAGLTSGGPDIMVMTTGGCGTQPDTWRCGTTPDSTCGEVCTGATGHGGVMQLVSLSASCRVECGQREVREAMRAGPKTEAAVMNVMSQFAEAFAKREVDATLAVLAPDPDVTFIGTGRDEKRIGLPETRGLLERDFAQFEGASLEIGSPVVSAAGSAAWIVAELTLRAKSRGREIEVQARLTAVLERREDEWFIVQFHASLPAAGQEEGEAFAT